MSSQQQIKELATHMATGNQLTNEIMFTSKGDVILPWDQLEQAVVERGHGIAAMDGLIACLAASGVNPNNNDGAVVSAAVIRGNEHAKTSLRSGQVKIRGGHRPDWLGTPAGPAGFQKGAEVVVTQAGAMDMLSRLRMAAHFGRSRMLQNDHELLRKYTGIRGRIVDADSVRNPFTASGSMEEITVEIPGVYGPDGGYWNFAPSLNHVMLASAVASAANAKHHGTFEQSSDKMIVCDLGDEFHTSEVRSVLPGTWSTWSTQTAESGNLWMETLTVHHQKVSLADLPEESWTVHERIGMDRCICGIVDGAVRDRVDYNKAAKLCIQAATGQPKFGAGVIPGGAVSYSGWGQESFNIHVARNGEGKVIAIRAYFINDPTAANDDEDAE